MPATARKTPTLPTVDDVELASIDYSQHKRLLRLRDYVAEARIVWWRRLSFGKPAFRDIEPKWHIFTGRASSAGSDSRYDFTWFALCGYENDYTDLLGERRQFKATAPKKADRCVKCEAALAKLKKIEADG